MSHVFVSNRFEALAAILGEELFREKTSLFGRKLLILPSLGLKAPLYFELLKRWPVVTGLQAMELNNAVLHLARLLGGVSLNLPSPSLLSLKLEALLVKEEGMPRKKGQKRADLLSRNFLQYGKYGGDEFLKWRKLEGEQQALFNQVFEEDNLYLDLDKVVVKPGMSMELHLFAIPFMPEVYHRFFDKLKGVIKVYFYELLPCKTYMGDLYTEGHHPFLTHFGKILAKKFKALEEKEVIDLYIEGGLTPLQHDLLYDKQETEGGFSVHQATSRLREVEILYAELVPLLKTYPLREIAVFAPDIDLYAPFIHLVFGKTVPYHLTDLEKPHPLIDFLALDEKRWDVESVFSLLPPKFRVVREWIEEEGVRWGLNQAHRKVLLGEELIETEERGTWEGALESLIRSVAETSAIEFSKVELLAEFFAFIQKLKREKEEMTLAEWTAYFQGFYPDFEGIGELGEEKFPLESVKRHFLKALKRKKGTYGTHQIESIRFSSLKLGGGVPYQVICMMGMNQGEFPRGEVPLSLAEVKGEYAPTGNDEDRHSLLELFGAVRDKFIMTYVESPSPALELIMKTLKISQEIHPSFAFHKSYLTYPVSEQVALAARSFYGKKEGAPFVPEFLKKGTLKRGEIKKVSASSLIKLMKHPVKFYFHESLKVYLEEKQSVGGEFTLSYLDKYKMKRNLLPEKVLPHGWYRDIADEGVEEASFRYVELNPYCKEKREFTDRVVLPALHVDGVMIEGMFEVGEEPSFVEKALEEGGGEVLSWFIEYYRYAKEAMSPLHPLWREPFLLGDQEKVQKEIEASIAAGGFTDPYLERVFKEKSQYSVEVMMERWLPIVSPLQEWL